MLVVKKVVSNVLSSNMYVLFEDKHLACWVIDIGDADILKEFLPDNIEVKGVFLTHGHFDHIAGINKFISYWPNAYIYTSEYGLNQLYSDKKNFSLYHEESIIYQGPKTSVKILYNGCSVNLFDNYILNVVATPGHCPSCLSYYTNEYIFTGDSYIPGVKVVTKLPNGDKHMAEQSLSKILSLSSQRIICAGHDLEKWQSFF